MIFFLICRVNGKVQDTLGLRVLIIIYCDNLDKFDKFDCKMFMKIKIHDAFKATTYKCEHETVPEICVFSNWRHEQRFTWL